LQISYVIPMFNAEATILETVQSILNGNFFHGDELIIVNDGSEDKSLSLAHELQEKYPKKIKVIDLGLNKGNETARNEGVKSAQNEYIFNLDADNILLPNSITKLKTYLVENDLDAAAFKHLYYFKKSTSKITHIWSFCNELVNLEDCLCGGVVPISSGNYLFKKSVWNSIGGYKVGAKALDAWFFGFETVALGYKLGVMPSGGYFHRYGRSSLWMRDAKKNIISDNARKLVLMHKSLLTPDDINYLQDSKLSKQWFENMDKRPIRTANKKIGKNGNIFKKRFFKFFKLENFEK